MAARNTELVQEFEFAPSTVETDLLERVGAIERRLLYEDEAEAWDRQLAMIQAEQARKEWPSRKISSLVELLDLTGEAEKRRAMRLEQGDDFAERRLDILRELVGTGWRPGENVPQGVIDAFFVDKPLDVVA